MTFMQKIMSNLPPKRMFSMFSNFLVFFVYPVLYTPHTVFRFLGFSLLVKIRQMSHKNLIGHFCIKAPSQLQTSVKLELGYENKLLQLVV